MLLLFTALSWSDDDFSSEKYCFGSPSQATSALQKFSAIQVNSDKVTQDSDCLIVQMRPHRRELIQRYFLSSYPETRISFSSAEVKREPCKLKVEKIRSVYSESTSAEYTGVFNATQELKAETQREDMEIETLGTFTLTVDQDEIKGTCRFINPKLYEITLEVAKTLRPLVPNVPPGTIVIVNNAPEDQETSALKTQVQLSHGEKIEIGNLIREKKNKDQKVDVKPHLNIETASKKSEEKVFLSLH